MYPPLFCFWTFLSVQFSISAAICFFNWSFMIVSIKIHISCKYSPYRRLNVHCMKSKNIRLQFIASSFRNLMLYFSRLRSIIYCSNNSSLFEILMHGTRISNGFVFFKDEGQIHFSYSTSSNQYGYLTCVKYKKNSFISSNENSLFAITEHKTLSRCLRFNV